MTDAAEIKKLKDIEAEIKKQQTLGKEENLPGYMRPRSPGSLRRSPTASDRPSSAPPSSAKKKGAVGVVNKMAEMEKKREERRKRIEDERKRRDQEAEAAADKGGIDSVEFLKMIAKYRDDHGADGDRPAVWEGRRNIWELQSRSQIRVCVRKRPMLDRERRRLEFDSLTVLPNGGDLCQTMTVHEPKVKVDMSKEVEHHEMPFDAAFSEGDHNVGLFRAVGCPQLIQHVVAGNPATIFCFGQTGSGKTVTMMGLDGADDGANGAGLYGLAAHEVFKRVQVAEAAATDLKLRVLVSFYEIYRGCVHDLLAKRARLDVRDDAKGRTWVAGLTIKVTNSAEEVEALIKSAQAARATAATAANAVSSRSHAVLQIRICSAGDAHKALTDGTGGGGKLCLVDLAGSERASDAASSDQQTRIEGAEINKSLLCLKECIRALDTGSKHTPFRGSKLTHVLKESFMGDARTVMIANVAPGSGSVEHTLNTLRYAARVKEFTATDSGDAGAPALAKLPEKGGVPPLPPKGPAVPASGGKGASKDKDKDKNKDKDKDKDKEAKEAAPASAPKGRGSSASKKPPTATRPGSAPAKKSAPAVTLTGPDNPVEKAAAAAKETAAGVAESHGRTDEDDVVKRAGQAAAAASSLFGTWFGGGRRPSSSRLSAKGSRGASGLARSAEDEALEELRRSVGGVDEEVEYFQTIAALTEVEQQMVEQHRQALLADEALLKQERILLQEMDDVDDTMRSTADYIKDLEAIITAKVELSMALQGQLTQFKLQLKKEEATAKAIQKRGKGKMLA